MDMIISDNTVTHFHDERNARYSLYSKLEDVLDFLGTFFCYISYQCI